MPPPGDRPRPNLPDLAPVGAVPFPRIVEELRIASDTHLIAKAKDVAARLILGHAMVLTLGR